MPISFDYLKHTFPHYKQPDSKDCGPTCLRIIAKHYGKLISLKEIREISETTREGSSMLKLSDAAEAIGFKTIGAKLSFDNHKEHLSLQRIDQSKGNQEYII